MMPHHDQKGRPRTHDCAGLVLRGNGQEAGPRRLGCLCGISRLRVYRPSRPLWATVRAGCVQSRYRCTLNLRRFSLISGATLLASLPDIPWTCATSRSSRMSTTARRPWSTGCCSSPAPSARTSRSRSGRWTATTSSASAGSPSSPSAPRWSGRACGSTSSTRRATPTSAARSSASCRWSTAACSWSTRPRGRCRRPSSCSARRSRLGLRPIVVINKVDKPEQRSDEVLNEIFDLFAALDADEHQLDFPHVYASAKQGWAVRELDDARERPGAAVRPDRRARAAAGGRHGRAVPDAGDDAGGQPLSRPPAHRPDRHRAGCGPTWR